MPFREISRFTRSPGTAGGLMRRIFIEDWSLKLLALAITLVLWFMVSGREIERELSVEPQLEGKPAPTYEVREVVSTPATTVLMCIRRSSVSPIPKWKCVIQSTFT